MKTKRTRIAVFLTSALTHSFVLLGGQSPLDLRQNDVIALLGAENLLRVQRAGHLEMHLSLIYPTHELRFRDLTWEGDTVFVQTTINERWREDKYGDWPDQLKHVRASAVWAQFGKMESLEGPTGLAAFEEQYDALIHQWKEATDRICLITPIAFESPNNSLQPDLVEKNNHLSQYVEVIRRLAEKHGLGFIDLFQPTRHNFTPASRLTTNGLHVLPEKQAELAGQFLRAAGLSPVTDTPLASPQLLNAITTKHRLWYEYWRPANWKCLFGDDGERIFGEAAGIYPTFREEWSRYPALIEQAEDKIRSLVQGSIHPVTPLTPAIQGWSRARSPNADLNQALADFELLEGFTVNLFASEQEALINPLAMRWDSVGNLYVACTIAYPQHEPGEIPNDYIVKLSDTTGDGVVDHHTVFAEGLNIPTGIEVAPNGIYVGQGTQLLLLTDSDNDGRADHREIVLSGFGNGDTHQTTNSIVWSPGGQLYWCQGDGIESRVETPWGVSRLFQAGVFRWRPERNQLEGLLDDFMGPGNPWGIAFDDYGQPIVIDGAGGVTHLGPALIPSPYRLRLPTIGRPGGYSGIDVVGTPALPDSMQGDFLIGDYKPNTISRFALRPTGASYDVIWKEPIISSKDEYFRPVDVKLGPDGAIYICDWFNTVICHQDDSYRHTARDKGHGRIWRVSYQGNKGSTQRLNDASISELVSNLPSRDRWLREQSKRELLKRDRTQVLAALQELTQTIENQETDQEFAWLQTLMMFETLEVVSSVALNQCLTADDARIRAYGARTVGRWHDRIDNPHQLLAPLTQDPDPQVRMETILACGNIPASQSVQVAARAMRQSTDRWIDYAFKQTVRFLEPHWIPALSTGKLEVSDASQDLVPIIQAARSRNLGETIRGIAFDPAHPAATRDAARHALAAMAEDGDYEHLLDIAQYGATAAEQEKRIEPILRSLIRAGRPSPNNDPSKVVNRLIGGRDQNTRTAALELAGHWSLKQAFPYARSIAISRSNPAPLREVAIANLPELDPSEAIVPLRLLAESPMGETIQSSAVKALIRLDAPEAARIALPLLAKPTQPQTVSTLLRAFLSRSRGSQALSRALEANPISAEQAQRLLNILVTQGYSDPQLTQVLRDTAGVATELPDYSDRFVSQLAKEISIHGNANAGESVFRSAAANCYSCHQIAGVGAKLGPDLSAAGTGIPIQRLIEEVIWPTRHVKEGYSLTQLTTKEGDIIQGYERKERDQKGHIILDEFATNRRIRLPENQIDDHQTIGSIMPPTAASLLTRPQLRDLIAFLSKLGTQGQFATRDRDLIREWQLTTDMPASEASDWQPIATRIDGQLHFTDIAQLTGHDGPVTLQTEIRLDDDEPESIQISTSQGIQIWIDGKPETLNQRNRLTIPPGSHQLQLQIDPSASDQETVRASW